MCFDVYQTPALKRDRKSGAKKRRQHEIEAEIDSGASKDRLEDEVGDLLFAVANLARHLKIDPETALRTANAKFVRRFAHIEKGLAARGVKPGDATLDEMEALWQDAKKTER